MFIGVFGWCGVFCVELGVFGWLVFVWVSIFCLPAFLRAGVFMNKWCF